MELTIDSLKLEGELEKTINSDVDIDSKTKTIKTLLDKLVTTEASIAKFTGMININNNKLNQNENG